MDKWGQGCSNPSGYKYEDKTTNPFFSYTDGGPTSYLAVKTPTDWEGYRVDASLYKMYTVVLTFALYYDYAGETYTKAFNLSIPFTVTSESVASRMVQDGQLCQVVPLSIGEDVYVPVGICFFATVTYEAYTFKVTSATGCVDLREGFYGVSLALTRVEVT